MAKIKSTAIGIAVLAFYCLDFALNASVVQSFEAFTDSPGSKRHCVTLFLTLHLVNS